MPNHWNFFLSCLQCGGVFACAAERAGSAELTCAGGLKDAEHMAEARPRPLTKFGYWQPTEAGPRYQLINGDPFMARTQNRFHPDRRLPR